MNYKIEKVGIFRKYKPIYDSKEKVLVGSSVKLIFKLTDANTEFHAERIWVEVTKIDEKHHKYYGKIDNDPTRIDARYGDEVTFDASNIFDIDNG